MNSIKQFILLFSLICNTAAAQSIDLKQILLKQGMENIAVGENQTHHILVLQNSTWRLQGVGLRNLIEALPTLNKPIQLVVLDNNIPQLTLTQQGTGQDSQWKSSYFMKPEVWQTVKDLPKSNKSIFKFDVVLYPEIAFRNIKLDKMYDWLVNLSPAIEFSAWKGMLFTGQVILPIVNQYGEQYSSVRLGYLTVAQQLRLPHAWMLKATIGNFNQNRWGVDMKVFKPFANERWAIDGQLGLTGNSAFYDHQWNYSLPKRVTGSIGAQYYNPRYNVQAKLKAARYIAGDYGVRGDVMRHFRHTTIGFYGLKTDKGSWNGGFYFTIALPPYKQARKRVRFTTAPYFDIEYNAGADAYYGRSYQTAPTENVSNGNFNPFFIERELK